MTDDDREPDIDPEFWAGMELGNASRGSKQTRQRVRGPQTDTDRAEAARRVRAWLQEPPEAPAWVTDADRIRRERSRRIAEALRVLEAERGQKP